MMISNELVIIIYTLAIILLVLLIIFVVKAINALNKVEKILDNVDSKVRSLDGLFGIIDATTDKLSLVSDSIFNAVYNIVMGFISRIRKKEEEDE